MPIFFLNIKRGKNVLGTQLNTNLTFGTMSGKNLKMVISKKGRTVKAPTRLIAADDEPAQVLTQVEMKDENAQDGCYEVVYNHKLKDFVRAEDGMDDDDQYHKEVYLPILYFWGCK